ncbi:hypothetical protein [Micromonospora sp. IBHARD004]|uniref:hypothetical protein n=1 Tax=Micromonospora sp. IBHARD004 TaxID=3457764 RepID=UPI00405819A1
MDAVAEINLPETVSNAAYRTILPTSVHFQNLVDVLVCHSESGGEFCSRLASQVSLDDGGVSLMAILSRRPEVEEHIYLPPPPVPQSRAKSSSQ